MILLTDSQQQLVCAQTEHWIHQASELWHREFSPIEVRFDLTGKTSGMFIVRHSAFQKEKWIRYNPAIFAKHFEESLNNTVPHEVAHYICHELYGRHAPHGKGNIRPHGKEWRNIMAKFGVTAEATCKLDISDLPQRKLKRYRYKCGCSEHQLTSIRHNRIQNGKRQYACPKCQKILTAI